MESEPSVNDDDDESGDQVEGSNDGGFVREISRSRSRASAVTDSTGDVSSDLKSARREETSKACGSISLDRGYVVKL